MVLCELKNWKVAGFYQNTAEFERGAELGNELAATTDYIDATVPGNVYLDLKKNGVIPDPFFDMNSINCEWVANRDWTYKTTFMLDSSARGKRIFLNFAGIDYEALIYLNEKRIGEHKGMFTPCILEITDNVRYDGDNVLKVILRAAPFEYGQIGHTSKMSTQKARFTYKWDFCTRLINIGLYDKVTVEAFSNAIITYYKAIPQYNDDWQIKFAVETDAISTEKLVAVFGLYDGNKCIEKQFQMNMGFFDTVFDLEGFKPRIWFPNGYGEQPLYDAYISIVRNGEVLDSKSFKLGFRTLEYLKPEVVYQKNPLPYLPVINGKRIYIKGVNMVPLFELYGAETKEDYRKILELAKNAGINLIRVWGGGFIEREMFYELCDEMGIMVWQEFIQSSSGMDNVPSIEPEYLKLLAKTSLHAIKVKRNHISLTFWSGGNELCDRKFIDCPDRNNHPVGFDDENISMLAELVEKNNSEVQFLPSSSSGGVSFLDIENPAENHDVHGPWQYFPEENYYQMYNNSHCLLQSEFGCPGLSSLDTLKTFMSDEHLKVKTASNDLVWRHHGEWWDSYDFREKKLFGDFYEDELENYILISQYLQGEGIRYAIESNRRRTWENCGCIVWQFNEPWPNVQCTNIIEYGNKPKMAYDFLKASYRRIFPCLKYNNIWYNQGDTFNGSVYVINEDAKTDAILLAEVLFDDVLLISKRQNIILNSESPNKAFDISFKIPQNAAVFKVKLLLEFDGKKEINEYLFFVKGADGFISKKSAINEIKTFCFNK